MLGFYTAQSMSVQRVAGKITVVVLAEITNMVRNKIGQKKRTPNCPRRETCLHPDSSHRAPKGGAKRCSELHPHSSLVLKKNRAPSIPNTIVSKNDSTRAVHVQRKKTGGTRGPICQWPSRRDNPEVIHRSRGRRTC